jgi:hypothetical protein
MRSIKRIILLFPAASLVACGGGGGSSDSGTVTVFPIEAAVTSYLTSPRNFTTTHTDSTNGDVYTLDYAHSPGADSTFEGSPAKTVSLTINLKRNGTPLSTSTQVDYFQTSPFRSLGTIDNTGEYTVMANQVALPATAKVDDSGNLHTSTTYSDSSKATVTATSVATWNLQRASPTTAFFCANSVVKSTDGSPDLTGSECYKIDANGNVTGNRITISFSGQTRVFTN